MLVVDDQQLFRDVAREVVEATPGLELAGEAACAESALIAVDELIPELVILDVRMPGMGGVELAHVLLERSSPPAVLLVSAQPPPPSIPALEGGGVAFVAKERLCPTVLRQVWETLSLLDDCDDSMGAEHEADADAHTGGQ